MNDYGELFVGSGAIAKLLREYDWSNTPIGPPDTWLPAWRTALRMTLDCDLPMSVYLGPEEVFFFNDAQIPLFGETYPYGTWLGRPFRDLNPEAWELTVKLYTEEVRRTNAGLSRESLRLVVPRNVDGQKEEQYYSCTFSPLRDDRGEIVGFYSAFIETTARVVAERRLDCLRRLSAQTFSAETPEQACQAAAGVLAKAPDLPVSLLYCVDTSQTQAELVGVSGLAPEARSVLPQTVRLRAGEQDPLRIAEAVRRRKALPVAEFTARVGVMSCDRSLAGCEALTVPITAIAGALAVGVLVVVPTPLRPAAEVREFVALVARQLAAALNNAHSKEHAQRRARELAELDRAKTLFLGNVSHELRTPLTLLLGPLQHVLESPALGEQERSYLEIAQRATGRLHKLVNALLDFARVEAGRMNASFRPTDLAALTSELASMFRSAFDDAGLDFIVEASELPEPVYVDPGLWGQIVLNLLSNALKYTFEGQVRLALYAREDRVLLEVSDTGCGIAPPELPHIFERFYRAQAPAARSQEGAGIGLSLVRELARLHGGEVEVESALGRGTKLTVQIPRTAVRPSSEGTAATSARSEEQALAGLFRQEVHGWLSEDSAPLAAVRTRSEPRAPGPAHDENAEHAARAGQRARLLVADDNADMRAYLRRILERKWSIETVTDGHSALAAAHTRAPDLVLADVMMPGLDGYELVAALRERPSTSEVPVILLSARAGEEASVQGLRAGAQDYIVKPFSPRELLARVDAQLARVEAQRADRVARETAERASLARERFLAMLAHELRNPLSFITGWTGMLRAGSLDAERSAHALEIIDSSALLMQRLMEDLLDVSRIAGGRLTLQSTWIETLAPQLTSLVAGLQPRAEQKGVTLVAAIEPAAGPIDGDVERLEQVVLNLIGNALKFTPSGGRVEFSCRRRDNALELAVRDTGRGISAAALPHLFEEFWKGDETGGRAGGLGLGLAIAHSIANAHGGTLTAASDGEGRGATFVLCLPLAAKKPSPPRAPSFGDQRHAPVEPGPRR